MRVTVSLLIMAALFMTAIPLEHPAGQSAPLPATGDNDMVRIPGGHFMMGTDPDTMVKLQKMGHAVPHMNAHNAAYWFSDESPRHLVDIEPFWMDIHEVTNRQFREFVSASGYEAQGNWERWATKHRDDFPVLNVSWHDANAYARWAGKRLPTEAEWEYAAGAGSVETHFPWGNKPDTSRANFGHMETFFTGIFRLMHLARPKVRPVCSYPSNNYGLHDMIGNALEWCGDPYTGYPGCGEPTSIEPSRRVIRGGCWMDNAVFCRIQNRGGLPPDTTDFRCGFRCAGSSPPEKTTTDTQ